MTNNDCECTLCELRREKIGQLTDTVFLNQEYLKRYKKPLDDSSYWNSKDPWLKAGRASFIRDQLRDEYQTKENEIKKDVLYS